MSSLNEANILDSEIKQLQSFIHTLDVSDLKRENSNVSGVIKKVVETKTTYSIFGRRFFGCGAHEHAINVPTSIIPTLVIQAKELLKSKHTELNNLFNK